MDLEAAKQDLQRELGNLSPDGVSAAALETYIKAMCTKMSKAPGIEHLQDRLRRAKKCRAAFFESQVAALFHDRGASIDFLVPCGKTPEADFLTTFRRASVVAVEVGSLASKDATQPGRHFVSDDVTDALIAQHEGGVRTLQSILREKGHRGASLVSRLRGTIRDKAKQLLAGVPGIVAIIRPLKQGIFADWVIRYALWGTQQPEKAYRKQTRIARTPVWVGGGTKNARPDGLLVLTPQMCSLGNRWPKSPDQWRFTVSATLYDRSLPEAVSSALAQIGVKVCRMN